MGITGDTGRMGETLSIGALTGILYRSTRGPAQMTLWGVSGAALALTASLIPTHLLP